MVDFYSNSKYLGSLGNKYPNGRDKPFYNIVNLLVDTAVVATDIDTKDLVGSAEDPNDYDKSFLYNHEIRKWMIDSNFALTLNQMGETRARYGGFLLKKYTNDDGILCLEVPEWKNLCVDPSNILGGVILEKHYFSPSELRKKDGVWKNIGEALKLYSKKGYVSEDCKIEIWEVHAEFSDSFLSDDADFNEADGYSRQVHYYAVNGNKSIHLYWAKDEEFPYKYLSWKTVAGRGLGRGVVEEAEESQVWTNDSIQKEHAAMELVSKIILKSNAKGIGANVATDYDNGSIISLGVNEDINTVNLLPGNIMAEFQNIVDKWFSQIERTTSSYDAVRGETPPSGQPYRLQALVTQAGSSQFDYRREEWGIFLNEVFNDWIFPYISSKINKKHILASDFSPEELQRLDEQYARYEANQEAFKRIFNGDIVTKEQYLSWQDQFNQLVGTTSKRRFLDIPDGYYKDIKYKLTLNITGEQKNKMAALETLSSLLQSLIPLLNSGIVSPTDVQTIINKIMELSGAGISPLSLSKTNIQNNQMNPGQTNPPSMQPPVTQNQMMAGVDLTANKLQ